MTHLLDIDRLNVSFRMRTGTTYILRNVSLRIRPGERVAVVGESGSGKSVLARAVMGLLPERNARIEGSIRFDGRQLVGHATTELSKLRGREIAMILQDPTSSLNPTFTIEDQFRSVLTRHPDRPDRKTGRRMMAAALDEVLIQDVDRVLDSYPSQLSGGMNQRVMIAMALINRPKLLIADEPGASLDVTVQAQTLRKMLELSDKYGTAILFISHNLGVVRTFANGVTVLYAGAVMEEAPSRTLFQRPRHPYTRCLMDAIPRLARPVMPKGVDGYLPDLHAPPPGCVFAPRCPAALPACATYDRVPSRPEPEHRSYCLRSSELDG